MYPEGYKIQAWYLQQAWIRSVLASGTELLAKGNKLCNEIEAFKRRLRDNLYIEFVNYFTIVIEFEESL